MGAADPVPNLTGGCPVCGETRVTLERARSTQSLLRCATCRLVYAWPLESTSSLYEAAYTSEGVYHDYLESTQGDQASDHIDWAMRRFLRRVPAGGRLLDVGCSTG